QKSGNAEDASRLENLQEFVSLTAQFEETREEGEPTLQAFLEHIALLTDLDEAEDQGNSVSLLTLHSAKGLEFPIVFMVGLEENIFPHQRSMRDEQELAEERRLCYVGITRAQRQLYLTHAFRRTIYGQPTDQRPSRFLRELPEGLVTRCQDVSRLARPQVFEEELEDLQRGGGRKLDLTRVLSRKPKPEAPRPATRPGEGSRRPAMKRPAKGAAGLADAAAEEFRTGAKVRHAKFGDGIVLSSEGDDATVTVAFVTVGVKKLALQYAKLEPR
ncbi:MAG: ATP-dependent DNA helicase PcrA, partial [Armatimonadetes bacterium]|nr:ATP-dependent DNA helicase PcrA [Armatimonadota bacterium]